MNEYSGDPEELMRAINGSYEGDAANRGHLKIFFGYAPGVGKTYAMLKAGCELQERGADVVIGYVKSNVSPTTDALMEDLESVPPLTMTSDGKVMHEIDIDAVIERDPQAVLVYDLAHTDAEGSRHAKRYQDVYEILKAGIDVYTTVNVQNIESLSDLAASITGVTAENRIPDRIFDDADQVEIIDIEPLDLIGRNKDGKLGEEKLAALREIALRRCADRMNKISGSARVRKKRKFYTDEHILVCLSPAPSNPKVIRSAARMAKAFNAQFTAIYVEPPDYDRFDDGDKKSIRRNMHLAEQLGASLETSYGEDPAFQISEFARQSGVSKIVLGRTNTKKKLFRRKPSLPEKLTEYASDLELYIIPVEHKTPYVEHKKHSAGGDGAGKFSAKNLLVMLGMIAASTAAGYIFYALKFNDANIIMMYIIGVLLIAVVTASRAYSLAASLLSVLVYNCMFTYPRFSFNVYDKTYPVTFIVMFLAAFITGTLAIRLKQNGEQSARTAYRTKALLDIDQMLRQAEGRKDIIDITARQLTRLLGKNIVFYPVKDHELQEPEAYPAEGKTVGENCLTEKERAAAAWTFKNNEHAGATTNTLSDSECYYIASRVMDRVYGVVGIDMDGEDHIDSFEYSILISMIGECALALEACAA